jgi:hypothetical protein
MKAWISNKTSIGVVFHGPTRYRTYDSILLLQSNAGFDVSPERERDDDVQGTISGVKMKSSGVNR